ncbi:MAG: DNA-processing protein DprA, partial [Candidatus Cloacimonetes bacterium]|nr:DNA-processing protein DprA [Candidatus Cloacimonadota bacterium]
ISQFEPSEKPLPHNFLNRNRVIAGLSSIVIVVQANERSCALVTARYAMEEGREVLAIPGAITDQLHRGTNRLIQQGAYLTLGIKDILELLPAEVSRTRQNVEDRTQQIPADYTHEQLQIMKLLQEQEQWHYDALAETLAEMSGFSTAILELELAGHLKRLPGNYVQASLKL